MYRFQKILLAIELIVVVAVTLYTGTYAAVDPEKVAVAETAETKKSETVKESESKKASETKKSKETQKKDKKKETEPETKTQQVVENKVKSEQKNSTNNSATGSKNNNSTMTSGGTASKPGTSSAASSPSAGNNNSSSSGTNHNASASSGGTSSKPSTSTPSTSAPSAPQTEAPEPERPQTPETTHTHNWVEQTHTVHHDATGHYEDVVVQDAWDEPVYNTVWKDICNGCGADITNCIDEHLSSQMLVGNMACGGYTTMPVQELTGYTHHDAVTESRWVEDAGAWNETVSDGYRCSGCGAAK